MEIEGLIEKALWENIPCCCTKGDITNSFPLTKCEHCRCQQCWDSVPQEDFTVNDDLLDEDGTVIQERTKVVSKIKLVRGSIEDVIGWTF